MLLYNKILKKKKGLADLSKHVRNMKLHDVYNYWKHKNNLSQYLIFTIACICSSFPHPFLPWMQFKSLQHRNAKLCTILFHLFSVPWLSLSQGFALYLLMRDLKYCQKEKKSFYAEIIRMLHFI